MSGGREMQYYRIAVAARLVGLPPARLRRYVRAGLVQPTGEERGAPLLGERELARLRRMRRLTVDLGLNAAGVEVAMRLLDEIAALRAQLAEAQARLDERRA